MKHSCFFLPLDVWNGLCVWSRVEREWNSGRDGDWNRFEMLLEMGGMCVILVVEGNSEGNG